MSKEFIYKPNWRYDCWSDIKGCFPRGSKVTATVKSTARNYAFLSTREGVTCFLDKRNAESRWIVNDLTQEITQGETVECIVLDYNFEKRSLTVSLKLN